MNESLPCSAVDPESLAVSLKGGRSMELNESDERFGGCHPRGDYR